MVGKNTPVWRNKNTGKIVCGQTVQEGLGVGYLHPLEPGWVQVSELPTTKRVVIQKGKVMPTNDLTTAIAEHAAIIGPLTVEAYGRRHKVKITYVDNVRIMLG